MKIELDQTLVSKIKREIERERGGIPCIYEEAYLIGKVFTNKIVVENVYTLKRGGDYETGDFQRYKIQKEILSEVKKINIDNELVGYVEYWNTRALPTKDMKEIMKGEGIQSRVARHNLNVLGQPNIGLFINEKGEYKIFEPDPNFEINPKSKYKEGLARDRR